VPRPALAIGIANYMSAAREMEAAADEKLVALMESRRQALSDCLGSIEQDMRFQATNPYVHEALIAYEAAWAELGFDQSKTLQRLYIDDNPNPTGRKENLDMADDGSTYSQVHGSYDGDSRCRPFSKVNLTRRWSTGTAYGGAVGGMAPTRIADRRSPSASRFASKFSEQQQTNRLQRVVSARDVGPAYKG
jgi:uncharacterized protein (DUF2235 family)